MRNKINLFLAMPIILMVSACSNTTVVDPIEPDVPPIVEPTIKTLDDCTSTQQIDCFKQLGYKPLFRDNNFKRPFRVSKNNSTLPQPHHTETISLYDSEVTTPVWGIGQWSTQFDILDELGDGYTHEVTNNGLDHRIISGGKVVNGINMPAKIIGLSSETGSIYLEANTQVEYDHPRRSDEGWVHLLMEQDFGNNLVYLRDCESVVMEATYEIKKFDDIMGATANTNMHAAQFVWYITIQNRNMSSASYGSYIWFGINLWDNRSSGQETSLYAAHDGGTSSFIYSPASSTFLASNNNKLPNLHEKVTARLDVMSVARTAYDLAIQRGYLGTTNFDDLAIGGMNFGFEIPGTYNLGVNIESIGVFTK